MSPLITYTKIVREALVHLGWRQAMTDELCALHNNGTCELVLLPLGKFVVGCKWVFTIKFGPDGTIDCLKAYLVVEGYTKIFWLDYGDTFSPTTKMIFVCLFIVMVALQQWPFLGFARRNLYGASFWVCCSGGSFRMVCHLRKSLYGLQQSFMAWFGKFNNLV